MSIFEVIIKKGDTLKSVFYSTKSAQAVRRHYEFLGYEVVIIKNVTKEYLEEIETAWLEIKSHIIMSDAVYSLLDKWFGDILQHYKE